MNLRKRIAVAVLAITAVAGIAAPSVETSDTPPVAFPQRRCC